MTVDYFIKKGIKNDHHRSMIHMLYTIHTRCNVLVHCINIAV